VLLNYLQALELKRVLADKISSFQIFLIKLLKNNFNIQQLVVFLKTNYGAMKEDQLNEAFVRYESLGNGDIIHLIHFARKGISYAHFQQLSRNTPFPNKEWSDILHISERTLQRYKKEGLSFEPLQSERIIEIALLQRKGTEVFGTPEKFFIWLNSLNISLGNVLPRELLDNAFGIGLIKDELLRIEHGILA